MLSGLKSWYFSKQTKQRRTSIWTSFSRSTILALPRALLPFALGSAYYALAPAVKVNADEITDSTRTVVAALPDAFPLQLHFVQAITRHGARTPISPLPQTDNVEWDCENIVNVASVYNAESVLPPSLSSAAFFTKHYMKNKNRWKGTCPSGALTKAGFDGMVALGQNFRNRYISTLRLLSDADFPSKVYVRSSDEHRTLHSALGFMMGFFPLKLRQNNTSLYINTTEAATETIYPSHACARGAEIAQENMSTEAYKQDLQKLREQIPDQKANSFSGLTNTIECFQKSGNKFPAYLNEPTINYIVSKAGEHAGIYYNTREAQKLAIGRFVKDLLQDSSNVISGATPYKILYYSAHDTTILPLLFILESYDGKYPATAANIVIEYYQNRDKQGDWFVQIFYNEKRLVVPGLTSPICPWEYFKSWMQQFIPTDYERECRPISPPSVGPIPVSTKSSTPSHQT